LKSVPIIIVSIALGVAAWLLPMRGEQATAQPGTPHILVVEFDIVPAEIDKLCSTRAVPVLTLKRHARLWIAAAQNER
jgi:hypothetical protein